MSERVFEIRKVIIVAIVIILLFPIRNQLKDGGTVEYKAILYKVSKVKRLISVEEMKKKKKLKNMITELL